MLLSEKNTHATLFKNDPTKIVFQVLKGFNVLKNDTNDLWLSDCDFSFILTEE